ncbi:MAG: cytidine deaminase [Anaerolineae bacterium]|nr:MAG: cytidine deaminase [Anaerolineae bacterium]
MSDHPQLSIETRDRLIAEACAARSRAYAPYSRFTVGAALLADDGRVYTGVNIENASYGMTVCAERNAIGTMVNEGGQRVVALAVCTANGVTPCGACRQVLSEFAPDDNDVPVWIVDGQGNVRETTLAALLPDDFGARHLRRG